VLFDAMGWQDQDLCRGLLRGFHVAGDLSQQKKQYLSPQRFREDFQSRRLGRFLLPRLQHGVAAEVLKKI